MTSTVFLALALIVLVGSALNFLRPDLDLESARHLCGQLVLNVFLPALNFEVVYRLPIGREFWQIPLVMAAGALFCVVVAAVVLSRISLPPRVKGSLVLASAFGNVTYLGIPVLRALFPEHLLEATEAAILCEVTVTSLDLITSSAIAPFYGGDTNLSAKAVAKQVAKFPLLWAVAPAAACNVARIPIPAFVMMAMHLLGDTVSGLMLLILGTALKPAALLESLRKPLRLSIPLVIKLALSPIVVFFLARGLNLPLLDARAATIEAAMPPQLFMLITADKTELDTEYLAVVVLTLTALSFVTLPIVNSFL